MRYTVTWLPGPEADLIRIWLAAPDQQAVADASDRIERLLRRWPLQVGHAEGDYRRFTVDPLSVMYRVSPLDCLVEVLEVEYVGP